MLFLMPRFWQMFPVCGGIRYNIAATPLIFQRKPHRNAQNLHPKTFPHLEDGQQERNDDVENHHSYAQ